jgi:hypothetical protein
MIKGDPIEPSRLELYYKQITMKYRENKSNITEYKQKEIQEKKPIACTLTPYKEEHGGSSSKWGRERSSTMDGGQRNWRGEDRQKLQKKTQKNTETDRKVIQQNTKQKLEWRRRGMRKKDGGTGSRDIK